MPSVKETKKIGKKTSVGKAYSRIILPGSFFFLFIEVKVVSFILPSFDDLLYNKTMSNTSNTCKNT